jgi:deoxyribose-phosphate aldolase
MNLEKYIEHTILRPDSNFNQIKNVCEDALLHNFAGICIPPYFVKEVKQHFEESPLNIVTVVGFPMGYSSTSSKVEEVKRVIDDGADEIDMVLNLCAVKDAKWAHVKNDIDSVTVATHLKGKKVKLIIEAALLTHEEIKKISEISIDLGVDYIKTSTGINAAGANVEMVKFIKKCIENTNVKIKASGGIKTRDLAIDLVNAGASRLGTSSSLSIIKEI